MSEQHVDNNVKQTAKSVAQVSIMGNLFSKERDPGRHDSQREALLAGQVRPSRSCSAPAAEALDQDTFLKIFDKAVAQGSLLSETSGPQVIESEKVILNAFLNEVRNAKPAPLKNWSALQHYIYFIYRHVISDKPCNSNEIFPNVITKRIRELVESLLQEDIVQLCVRLVTLVREYAVIARGHFNSLQHQKITAYLVSLMSYYSAFCSAASKLAPLLPEFDFLIMERFNVNWLCLNKSIFYHYVYVSPAVQAKIPVFLKLKEENKSIHKNLLESYACFSEDMTLIAARWATLKMRISNLSHKRALTNPAKHLLNDWRMFEEQKKILKTNYWVIRNTQAIQVQDMAELDAHILSLVGDTAYIADFLIDSQGHCMCEDCLAAEFKSNSVNNATTSSAQSQSSTANRLITCYICQEPIALNALASHVVAKHHDSHTQKNSRVYLTPHQKRLTKKTKSSDSGRAKDRESFPFEGLFEKNIELKESLLKLVNGRMPKSTNDKECRDQYCKTDETCKSYKEVRDSSSQPMKKVATESAVESTGVEELKHKPASSRISETSCSLKSASLPISQAANKSRFKTAKDPVFKIASEAPVLQNGTEPIFKGALKSIEEKQTCRITIGEFLKLRNEAIDLQTENEPVKRKSMDSKKPTEVQMKSTELFSTNVSKVEDENGSDEDLSNINFAALAAPKGCLNKPSAENGFRKPQQKCISSVDQKMFEFLKNANGSKSTPGAIAKHGDTACTGHACGHKCKLEDDKQPETKKHSCQDTCEYHKESRRCDCAYCEVFGASLPYTHKTNETRDRLRTRLNQRKEKVNENLNKGVPKGSLNSKLSSKSNGSLNCTIKITGSSKISMLNGKTLNVNGTSNGKTNSKPVVNEPDTRVPPRVPEVVHPVPPPASNKPITPVELKKPSTLTDGLNPALGIHMAAGTSASPLYTADGKLATEVHPSTSVSTCSLNSDNVDSRDINELLNYIEGHKRVDKAALAQKKAAKKARQRVKKAQERERIETEKRLKEEARLLEEKRKEEERLKAEALAKQLAEKQKKTKKIEEETKLQQKETKKSKKKAKKSNEGPPPAKEQEKNSDSNLIEETIPAMVTIKRVSEGSNSPATVTITLKGSTPESDKLLFTLVNGHTNKEQVTTATINTENNKLNKPKPDPVVKNNPKPISSNTKTDNDTSKNIKKKKKKDNAQVASKEVKVTIAVDKNNVTKKTQPAPKKSVKQMEAPKVVPEPKVCKSNKEVDNKLSNYSQNKQQVNNSKEDINLPMLRLPPGITITKIEGPPSNKNCRVPVNSHHASSQSSHNPNVPVSKSGVIVVDTEKLIQQSITASNNKKNKKKNKKKKGDQKGNVELDKMSNDKSVANGPGSSMVTLKNPIFHTLQTALSNKVTENPDLPVFPNNQQASIFKNENGMVTIRSPRLQNSYENGSPISSFLSDLKPMFGPESSTPYVPMCHSNFSESANNSPFNAQEILSGLPGIEITKVDKNCSKSEPETKKASQPAEVSIIPTRNGANAADKFNFDKDDWPFESVFTPRDVLEEDMDAEERELEAFKRFCQQSVPPERKKKVAHLNVKDIILNKKRDVTYS